MKKSSLPEQGTPEHYAFVRQQSEEFIRDELQMNEFANKCFPGRIIQDYFPAQDDERIQLSPLDKRFLNEVGHLVVLKAQGDTLLDEDAKRLKKINI